MITETFNLISNLKNIEKCELLITEDEEAIMRGFHRKLKGIISYKLWKKIVIDYSIESIEEIYDSCDMLVDIIYKKYKR